MTATAPEAWPSREEWESRTPEYDHLQSDPPPTASNYASAEELAAIVAALKEERRTLRHPDPDTQKYRKHRLYEAIKAIEKEDRIPLVMAEGGRSAALCELQRRWRQAADEKYEEWRVRDLKRRHSDEGWQKELERRAMRERYDATSPLRLPGEGFDRGRR